MIGNGCIIDNQVQIGHNCQLEEGVIVCGCTGLAGSVQVGKYAVLAGFVGVANKARIGAGSRISAYSAITGLETTPRNIDPGLLVKEGAGSFTLYVYPVPPGGTIEARVPRLLFHRGIEDVSSGKPSKIMDRNSVSLLCLEVALAHS